MVQGGDAEGWVRVRENTAVRRRHWQRKLVKQAVADLPSMNSLEL